MTVIYKRPIRGSKQLPTLTLSWPFFGPPPFATIRPQCVHFREKYRPDNDAEVAPFRSTSLVYANWRNAWVEEARRSEEDTDTKCERICCKTQEKLVLFMTSSSFWLETDSYVMIVSKHKQHLKELTSSVYIFTECICYYHGVIISKKTESDRDIRETRNVFNKLKCYEKRKDYAR